MEGHSRISVPHRTAEGHRDRVRRRPERPKPNAWFASLRAAVADDLETRGNRTIKSSRDAIREHASRLERDGHEPKPESLTAFE